MLEFAITCITIIAMIASLIVTVIIYTYAERKLIGFVQSRIGPNRVGPAGILQPIADVLKLLLKEIILPRYSNKLLFLFAPILGLVPALIAWAVIPIDTRLVLANLNIGLVYLLAVTSLGVYSIIIAGWATNSKYALLSSLRSGAQIISYEIPMGFAILGVLMASQSANLTTIVLKQQGGILNWYWLPLLPLMVVYFISAVAETNRLPFDMAEGESEIVGGFQVEYSGILFGIFFLTEYMNMILVSALAVIMFFGGWLAPISALNFIPGPIWLFAKTLVLMLIFLWLRATFPRFRYDQIMRLGWKVFIPITLFWILIEAFAILLNVQPWFSQ